MCVCVCVCNLHFTKFSYYLYITVNLQKCSIIAKLVFSKFYKNQCFIKIFNTKAKQLCSLLEVIKKLSLLQIKMHLMVKYNCNY